METTMGRVLTEITLENLQDLWDVDRGLLPVEKVRRLTVPDALVDTGATFLSLPKRFIEELGLRKMFVRTIVTSIGPGEASVFGPVRLTIQGRVCNVDVMELPDSVPVLVGQLPLESLDFVVDPRNQRLIGNPEHGGQHIIEAY
jgi:predicted aspartyl protease